MKDFIIVGLVVFLAYLFLSKKSPQTSNLGSNTSLAGNGGQNPNGGQNAGSAIVGEVGSVINNLIDNIFDYAEKNDPPDTNTDTI